MTVIVGLCFLAWTATLEKLLLKRQQSEEQPDEQVYDDLKSLKLVVISAQVVGLGLICKYIFRLY